MPSIVLWRLVAVALYGAYFALWLFGFVDIDRSNAPQMSRELYYGLTIGVPCFLVGAALARWWAPAVGLVLVAFLPLGQRCVESRQDGVLATTCSGAHGSDVLLLLGITTPCVVAGVIATRLAAALWRHISRAGPPGVDGVAVTPSAGN